MVNSSSDYSLIFKVDPGKSKRVFRSKLSMHSSTFTSARHYPSQTTSTRQHPYQCVRRASTFPSASIMGTDSFSPPPDVGTNASDLGNESDSSSTHTNPEAAKIQRNSLYLTFNAPRVDDYHRGIFLTHPPTAIVPETSYSGTLFHASYTSPSPGDTSIPSKWILEQRLVKDVSTAHSLVLLYRIGTLSSDEKTIEAQIQSIRDVLSSIPLGRSDREKNLGPLRKNEGNKALGGYDCVIWTRDAVAALVDAGLIDLKGRSAELIMSESRALAGPEDAKTMVGVDFGGFRVAN